MQLFHGLQQALYGHPYQEPHRDLNLRDLRIRQDISAGDISGFVDVSDISAAFSAASASSVQSISSIPASFSASRSIDALDPTASSASPLVITSFITTALPTATAHSPLAPNQESSTGLSTGAKIGIGLGVPFGVLLISSLIFLLCLRKRISNRLQTRRQRRLDDQHRSGNGMVGPFQPPGNAGFWTHPQLGNMEGRRMPEMENAQQGVSEMHGQNKPPQPGVTIQRSSELSNWGEVRELPAAQPGATVKDVSELSGMEKYTV